MLSLSQRYPLILSVLVVALVVPGIALAAPQTFKDLATLALEVINKAIPVIITFALFAFLFGLMKTLTAAGDSKTYGEGRNIMLYGIISLFVIVAVWALVDAAQRSIFGTTVQSTNITNPVTY